MGDVIGPYDQDDFNTMRELKLDLEFMRGRPDLDYHEAIERTKRTLKEDYFHRTLQ